MASTMGGLRRATTCRGVKARGRGRSAGAVSHASECEHGSRTTVARGSVLRVGQTGRGEAEFLSRRAPHKSITIDLNLQRLQLVHKERESGVGEPEHKSLY